MTSKALTSRVPASIFCISVLDLLIRKDNCFCDSPTSFRAAAIDALIFASAGQFLWV